MEANKTKRRSPHSQRQGQQHQLNQRERTIKRGEEQTEERDQTKKGLREEKENTETNADTDQTKEEEAGKYKDKRKT